MKVSRYTYCLVLGKEEFVLFNTLTDALIGLEKEEFLYIKDCQKLSKDVAAGSVGKELYDLLEDKRLITDNEADDSLLFRSLIQDIRSNRTSMHLTIAPTMDCIFRCHYCFEQDKNRSYMTSETIDAIVRYVTQCTELNRIHLTWFGGEPLMATHQMQELYGKLKAAFPHEIVSNIITTGFHLSKETINVLKTIDIRSVQITLDGHKASHNRIKFTTECDDVFSRTLANVDELTELAPEINVVFRVNLTKMNKDEYVPLYCYLTDRYKGKKVAIAPAFVMNRHIGKSNTDGDLYFNRKDASLFVLNLFRKNKIHSPWLRYPQMTCNECAIRNINALSFDADGYAYKCWEIIGNKKYAIGKISLAEGLTTINHRMLNRQLYGADPLNDKKCLKCNLLPICYGGCPIQRLQNEFEGYHNEVCTPYKDFLAQYIKIHLTLKNAGYENY